MPWDLNIKTLTGDTSLTRRRVRGMTLACAPKMTKQNRTRERTKQHIRQDGLGRKSATFYLFQP